ncbi:Nramp family divalent metal transporter [Salinarchaeum sp. IM2453]|uniref:Nramp family divalent metal transporter n=1 Tax=Salinarchaeum sp. IM2453 TaxID=2862870 RepID=UPI001C8284E7|nr:Nramp family divalent metal transporter [Salinarchaeum sp. IM2453]QZA88035.1 Nramp family divalent metal transporter [Salinarchaeum sp. IM2453]
MSSEKSTTDITLDYPASDWKGFFKHHFGPSMMWALISIGGSHIVLGPEMAATFGLFAVWVFAFVYVAKYGAWELGIRYNYGAGENPVEAYDQLPGPKNWMQWFTVIVFGVLYVGITASVGMSTAALAAAITPLSVPVAFVVFVGGAGILVFFAKYSLLEKILIGFTAALGALLILGVFAGPPSTDVAAETVFSLNLGGERTIAFVALFAAVAGFAPTGFSTSVLIGSWSMAKGEGASQLKKHGLDPHDDQYHDYIKEWIQTGRRDFNIGYLLSFVVVIAMVLLATNVLYPDPPGDENFAIAVGEILSESFGEWSFWAMMLGAFAALYSTVITLLDGASRAVGDVIPMAMENDDLDSDLIRRVMVVLIVVVSSLTVLILGNIPVTLLVSVAAILAVTEILFYPANYYIVKKNLPDAFQPSRAWTIYYALSLIAVLGFGVMGAAVELGFVPELVGLLS